MVKMIVAFFLYALSVATHANQLDWVLGNSNIPVGQAKEIVQEIKQASFYYRVDPRVVIALIKTESTFNPHARGCSKKDPCLGLMQVKPKLHAGKGRYKNLGFTTPKRNIDTGVFLLKEELDDCDGNYRCALQNYNRSPRKRAYAEKILAFTKKVPPV